MSACTGRPEQVLRPFTSGQHQARPGVDDLLNLVRGNVVCGDVVLGISPSTESPAPLPAYSSAMHRINGHPQ